MKKTKRYIKKRKENIKLLTAVIFAACVNSRTALANTGVPQVDTALTALKVLVIGIVGGVGLVYLIKGIGEMAQAWNNRDSSTMWDALKGVIAGVLMCAVGTVVTVLGF